MRGVNFKAVILAAVAMLGLDIVCGFALMTLLGGDSLASAWTEEQRREALEALTRSQAFLVWSFIPGTLTTVLGGYIAARIAKSLPYMNALAFGVLGMVIGLFASGGLPFWYNVLAFTTILPAALLGGHIAKRQMQEGGT